MPHFDRFYQLTPIITQIRLALSFLTTLPARSFSAEVPPETIGRSQRWFPLVGLIIGSLLLALTLLCRNFLAPQICAACVLLVHFLITGGFHLDGLADTTDGMMSGRQEKEKIFSIMKDSYLGSMGATSLILLLLLKFSAITIIIGKLPAALAIFPVCGRYAIVQLTFTSVYARAEGGLGAMFTNTCGKREWLTAGVITLSCALLGAGFKGLICLLATAAYTHLITEVCRRRLGGVTGDILGFACESSEALVLIILAAGLL